MFLLGWPEAELRFRPSGEGRPFEHAGGEWRQPHAPFASMIAQRGRSATTAITKATLAIPIDAYGVASSPGHSKSWLPTNDPLEIPRLKAAILKPDAVPSASGAMSLAVATTPACMTGGMAKANAPQTAITAKVAPSLWMANRIAMKEAISPHKRIIIALRVPTRSLNVPPARFPTTVAAPNIRSAILTASFDTPVMSVSRGDRKVKTTNVPPKPTTVSRYMVARCRFPRRASW